MPRKVQITKEQILNTALRMLIRDGYESVNIKSLAQELGSSTQTISWKFDRMEKLRLELAEAAFQYADSKTISESEDSLTAYVKINEAYINMAFDEPNLFRFIRMEESRRQETLMADAFLNHTWNEKMPDEIAKALGLSRADTLEFMQCVIVYTIGLATLIVTGTANVDKKTAHRMVRDTEISFLSAQGISKDKAEVFLREGIR